MSFSFFDKNQVCTRDHPVFLFIVAMLVFVSCNRDKTSVQEEDLKALKRKYDTRTINYFYETVFHEDFAKQNSSNLWKWTSDPTIVISGHASRAYTAYVREVIAKINTLGLPVHCRLAQPPDRDAIELFFRNVKDVSSFLDLGDLSEMGVDTGSTFGFGMPESYGGNIVSARIGMYYGPDDSTAASRKKLVLEEIVQVLGVLGDSYTYPSSLFFQNSNSQKQFTKMDREVLKLLYEPAFLPDYARRSFEKDFADQLYSVNAGEKLQRYFRRFPVSPQIVEDLNEIFSGDVLLKHPSEVNVFLYGASNHQDSATIAEASAALSRLSPNLKIVRGFWEKSEPDHGIVITLAENRKQKSAILHEGKTMAGQSCMYPKIIKNSISLSFNLSDRSKELRQQSLVSALYFSLVPINMTKSRVDQLYKVTNGKISFSKHYAELLRIVYANELVDGFSREAFQKLKSS